MRKEKLKELNSELQSYQKKIQILKDYLKVNMRGQLLDKVREVKNKKKNLSSLKVNYAQDIQGIESEIQ